MTKEAMEVVTEPIQEENKEKSQMSAPPAFVRVPVKHANLGIRSHAMDMSTMVELTSFSTLGKIQPFLVTITSTAALLVDLHCHLSDKEVCGYLGGHWDINAHNLSILGAFPCRYSGKDKSAAAAVEAEIARVMEWKRMTLVGWYHSHPRSHASPSLRDVDAQLDYQIKMKGSSDNGYTPCVGLICSPYNTDGNCYESNFNIFWSMPPPENRPHEYPRPMLLSFTLSQDQFISQDSLDEIKKCVDYYKIESSIDFTAILTGNTTYLDRLKNSLASKLPGRNRSNCSYWDLIREMICPGSEDTSNDTFMPLKFPLVSESLLQHNNLNTAGNVFITPVNFKSDNITPVSLSKQFSTQQQQEQTSQVPTSDATSTSIQFKDSLATSTTKQQSLLLGSEPVSTFRAGDLTVSLKNSKSDYEFPVNDFSKTSTSILDHSNKIRPSIDFPMSDHMTQHMSKFPDLSKLTTFSPVDLAKLSGFSLNDFTKAAESPAAYVRNIANLFGPLGKTTSDISEGSERRPGEYSSIDMLQNAFKTPSSTSSSPSQEYFKNMSVTTMSEDYSSDRKKINTPDVPNYSGTEDLTMGNNKANFGSIIDMTAGHTKKPQHPVHPVDGDESLNLSKDRQ